MGACAPTMHRTGESLFKSMGAWVSTMYRMGESLFKSMGAWISTMYRTGEPLFKSMGAWAPKTFSKGGCEKYFFENTHNVRTVSFQTMYSESSYEDFMN